MNFDNPSSASAKADAGTYQVSVEGGEADNYRFQYIPADFIVLKKAITGKVGTLNRIYGAANPTAKDVLSTVVYSGLANDDQNPGEIAEATVVTTATTESATGIYDISLTATESQNYELEYLAGTCRSLLCAHPALGRGFRKARAGCLRCG